jgi:hypothetical protein
MENSGIKCLTEVDGLRVLTEDGSFLLESVHKDFVDIFDPNSDSPPAYLLRIIRQILEDKNSQVAIQSAMK